MSNPWKAIVNIAAAALLFLCSLALAWDDFTYSGEILFQTSFGMVFVILISLFWFLAAHFVAVFPKRFLFPIVTLISMRLAIGFPLNLWMENNQACFYVSVAITFVTGLYLLGSIFRLIGIRKRDWFRWQHSVTVLVTGIVLGLLSIPLSIGGMAAGAQNFLGDYTRFSFKSISLLERVFVRDGKKVFLVGMMHIGEGDFYEDLNKRMGEAIDGRRVVLTEGVSDETGVLPKSFASGKTYGKWAKKLGLKVQDEDKRELTQEEREQRDRDWAERGVEFINADIDVSELSQEHQDLLVKLLEAMGSDNLAVLISGPEDVDGQDLEDLVMDGLIKFRNDRLMEKFDSVFEENVKEVYIPWGAAHMPDIEERLINQGFLKIHEETRPVIRFWKKK